MSRILFLEPFYGGSHRNVADNFKKWSSHKVDIVSLPEAHWKWRIRSSAYYFLEKIPHPEHYDLLMLPSMLQLADLKAFWGNRCPPVVVYFHETQLSYPLPPGVRADYHLYFTEFSNALHGDFLLFNSHFHRNRYLNALPGFIDKIPDYQPLWIVERIREKSMVLYPGVEDPPEEAVEEVIEEGEPEEPVILWNHRWDYDKQPEIFFRVLRKIDPEQHPFKLVLLGENAQFVPKVFSYAKERYGKRILQYGWTASRKHYWQLLHKSRICVSTAAQENFGLSMVEAACTGCVPLLPNRLSYPELIPEGMEDQLLYTREEEMLDKLIFLLDHPPSSENIKVLRSHYQQHCWSRRIDEWDRLLTNFT